jgi:hypothetical protein
MNIHIKAIVLLVCTYALRLNSQAEFSKWYFGVKAGLDFSTSPPTALTNGSLSTPEGCATVSDNMGNLLFYTDGITIYNSLHAPMTNSPMYGDFSSTQAAIIVKQPGSQSIYYVFTTSMGNPGHQYSVVDMALAGGLGSVTAMNNTIYLGTCEKQVAVRHCNGKDVWIVSHEYGTNNFRSYLLSPTGLTTSPVISAVGETLTGNGITGVGQIKISRDGRKLAVATATMSIPSSAGTGGFFLYDFDAATGVVSNPFRLVTTASISGNTGAYAVEFSPDGTKLFGVTSPGITSSYTCTLYQWDICSTSTAAIIASQYSMAMPGLGLGSLQWAIDGKIYLAASNQPSLTVINNPNASGTAMNLSVSSVGLGGKLSSLGLPNYINGFTRNVPAAVPSTVACQSVSFAAPAGVTFTSGCSTMPYAYSGYLYDFGEPSSGSANSATVANASHTYSGTGTYTVKVILYGSCTNDTIVQTVNVTSLSPQVNVTGITDICKGDRRIYTASGASTYQWSNNTTSASATLAPTTNTVYSVTGYSNGCSTTKTFTVNVGNCVGLDAYRRTVPFAIFPNPAAQTLNVQAETGGTLKMFDINGKLVLERPVKENTVLDITTLPDGIYTVTYSNPDGSWHSRLVKVE